MALIALISEQIGEIKSARLLMPSPELRRRNRIKTIQSTLGIEGNTLSVSQVTALINENRVLGPPKDILEVKNAIQVYDQLDTFDAFKTKSLLKAHKLLMTGLMDWPGEFRSKSVGIARGKDITHIAPPSHMVYSLVTQLFKYVKSHDDILLLKSCVFHYELEFIHPFSDGNGRMGRLWQTLILMEYSPVFKYLPIETLIKERQNEYYRSLAKSDGLGRSTPFIEFILDVIHNALEELLNTQSKSLTAGSRMELFNAIIKDKSFSRKDYMRRNKEISAATASRDLKEAVDRGILIRSGDKRLAVYQFV